MQGATGSGKTVEVAAIIQDAVEHGDNVVFVAHRRELITQASSKLHAFGLDHGVIQAGFPTRPAARVQVASVQTLHARAFRSRQMDMPPAELLIFDECHHVRARTYMQIAGAYPDAIVLGLTATPIRGDGRGLGNVFDTLIEGPPIAELIAGGFLVPTRVYAPSRPDLSGVRVKMGDYVETQLAERMNTKHLVGDIVTHWHRLSERRRTVVFATGVAHSVHIRDEFRRSGVWAEHLDGSTPKDERDSILARLASGTVDLVTNAMVLTEGWDSPSVSCIVLARPTKSLGLYFQMTGRVLRPWPGKTDALVIDHAGAVFQHGFVDDPIEWALSEDDRAVNAAHQSRIDHHAPALTTCPECSAVRFEGQPCTVCGWRPVRKPKAVEVVDGELGEVDRNRNVKSDWTSDEQFAFYRQLMGIAQQRNYKPGWAAQKFKEKFSAFPPWSWNGAQPVQPSPAVSSWVRSRNIAYARSMVAQ
jgi:superfamily II DNA or RNA helicase